MPEGWAAGTASGVPWGRSKPVIVVVAGSCLVGWVAVICGGYEIVLQETGSLRSNIPIMRQLVLSLMVSGKRGCIGHVKPFPSWELSHVRNGDDCGGRLHIIGQWSRQYCCAYFKQ